MTPPLSNEELAQLHQTIEMFEVIAQTQPDDFQSLEILKEAYAKLGRRDDALKISKQLVRAYYTHGQLSAALLECEEILAQEPDSREIQDAIIVLREQIPPEHLQVTEVASPSSDLNGVSHHERYDADAGYSDAAEAEEAPVPPLRLVPMNIGEATDPSDLKSDHHPAESDQAPLDYGRVMEDLAPPGQAGLGNGRLSVMEEPDSSPPIQTAQSVEPTMIELDYGGRAQGGLVESSERDRTDVGGQKRKASDLVDKLRTMDDGTEALARHAAASGAASLEAIKPILARVMAHNKDLADDRMAVSLVEELARAEILEPEAFIADLISRAQMPYVPLEYYDVDRDTIRMLPPEVSLHRLILPFDVISRTLMVALANPLDAPARDAVVRLVDYGVQWFIARPGAIQKQLSNAFRIEPAALPAS